MTSLCLCARLWPTAFGRRLFAERLNRRWSQSELARRTGVGRVTIASWERGWTEPREVYRMALRAALDVGDDEDDTWLWGTS